MELLEQTPSSPIKELFKTATPEQASEEIQFKNSQYVKSGVKSSNSFFGFFKALFRTSAERENNQSTIRQVRNEIIRIFGQSSKVLKKFDQAFSSKLSSGSPLTKGALLEFKNTLLKDEQDILQGDKRSGVEDSKIDAEFCFKKAQEKTIGQLDKGYWQNAGTYYKYQSAALAKGDRDEAKRYCEIATGYKEAAKAYSKGEKDLAHYFEKWSDFYKAEKLALENNELAEAENFKNHGIYYSEAIKAEKAGKKKVAEYLSKAAKCFDAAERADWNKRSEDARKLISKAKIYNNAAFLAYNADASSAASITKEADEFIERYYKKGHNDSQTFSYYFSRPTTN